MTNILESAAQAAVESWNSFNNIREAFSDLRSEQRHMARAQARAVLVAVRDSIDNEDLRFALNRIINEPPPEDEPDLAAGIQEMANEEAQKAEALRERIAALGREHDALSIKCSSHQHAAARYADCAFSLRHRNAD